MKIETRCPKCGAETEIKRFGPFFTPDPVWYVARACPRFCFRGPLRKTCAEAEADSATLGKVDTIR